MTERRLKDCFSSTCGHLTTQSDYKTTGLYPGELKSGTKFALEPDWAYIQMGLYLGGPLFGILRYYNSC